MKNNGVSLSLLAYNIIMKGEAKGRLWSRLKYYIFILYFQSNAILVEYIYSGFLYGNDKAKWFKTSFRQAISLGDWIPFCFCVFEEGEEEERDKDKL
jgi:hypothetical protein